MGCSSAYIPTMNIQAPVLGWLSASELWTGITGASGSNPSPDGDRPSVLISPPEDDTPTRIRRDVLIVEDNDADLFLIQQAIDAKTLPIALYIVRDGEQAVRFFDQADSDASAPVPALVILDINLPKSRAARFSKHMRRSSKCRRAFVIAVSTFDSARDREQMKKLGANEYFCKPSGYVEFMKLGELVKDFLGRGAGESRI